MMSELEQGIVSVLRSTLLPEGGAAAKRSRSSVLNWVGRADWSGPGCLNVFSRYPANAVMAIN